MPSSKHSITNLLTALGTNAVAAVSNDVYSVKSLLFRPYRLTVDNQEEVMSELRLKIGDQLKAVTKPVRGDRGFVIITKE